MRARPGRSTHTWRVRMRAACRLPLAIRPPHGNQNNMKSGTHAQGRWALQVHGGWAGLGPDEDAGERLRTKVGAELHTYAYRCSNLMAASSCSARRPLAGPGRGPAQALGSAYRPAGTPASRRPACSVQVRGMMKVVLHETPAHGLGLGLGRPEGETREAAAGVCWLTTLCTVAIFRGTQRLAWLVVRPAAGRPAGATSLR